MKFVAIVHEDNTPIRAFEGNACINKAYRWCWHHYCLADSNPELRAHQLPEWLNVTFHMMTEEQFTAIIK